MLACCMSGLRGPVASEVGIRVGGGEVVLYRALLVGGLSRGVRGGQTRRPVGSGVSHLLTCYTTWATVYIIFLLGSEITFTSPGPWPLNPIVF